MPLEADDQIRVDQALEDVGADQTGTRLAVLNALSTQKLGFWTIVGTVVNRCIGKDNRERSASRVECEADGHRQQVRAFLSPRQYCSKRPEVQGRRCFFGPLARSWVSVRFWCGWSSGCPSRSSSSRTASRMAQRPMVSRCRVCPRAVVRRTT